MFKGDVYEIPEQKIMPSSVVAPLPLLPLKNVVLLPKSIRPVIVGRKTSIAAVEHALKHDRSLFITAQKNPDTEYPEQGDLYVHGTRATILQVMRMPDDMLKIIVEGICRTRMTSLEMDEGFLQVQYEDLSTSLESKAEIEAAWRHMRSIYVDYARVNDKVPADLMALAKNVSDMDYITDTIAIHLDLNFDERQQVLETAHLPERIMLICKLLVKEVDILQVEQRIKGRVQTQVEKNQREYYLTEQMKAIQKELGRDDSQVEVEQLRTQITQLRLSPEAAEKAERELRRLEQMPPLSAEASVSRNYIDWLLALPWYKVSKDRISLAQAEKILDSYHAGLLKPKERILEFLAAKKFSAANERSAIICLVGAPGVGKTSLGKSIADSMGRKFIRISLGGLRDEAEIRGHRRTYIGALPGKIVQAMRKAKTQNPVILLDEIDKMSSDFQGDPSSALLEVLDPEQNKTFVDHYLDCEYDLSKVMFIATANMSDTIPFPLLDRMELVYLSGYSEEEKLQIAEKFLIPKNLAEHGLKTSQFVLDTPLLKTLIFEYTKEAGVRQLERIIAKLMRKVIQVLLKDATTKKVVLTAELIKQWLSGPKYKKTTIDAQQARIGVATGLAWTEVGGDILDIEVSVVPGKGTLMLTGQLGEVMQESGQAALSYVRSRTKELGLPAGFQASKDMHIHIPEGATPKDGPSAGITMCVGLVSALTKNPIKSTVAMTGEITLRGRVLAIGGLKEKILAARRHGCTLVLVPKENNDDIEEIKREMPIDIEIAYVDTMDEVLKYALVNDPFAHPYIPRTKKKKAKKTTRKLS